MMPAHQKAFIVRMAYVLAITATLLVGALLLWVWANPGVIGIWGGIAFVGCLLATFLLGAGLMGLSFYSARAGFDDKQNDDGEDVKKDRYE
jgi:hypothetical protein